MTAALSAAGVAESKLAVVATVCEVRSDELRQALVTETHGIGGGQLVDFDWSVKVALASDSLSELNEPLFHLRLSVRYPGGELKDINMELSADELDDMIAKLEAADKVLTTLV